MKNLNLVHLNGLRAVEAVGRLGSLQAAAEELGVSLGAVSQQVIKAERQLGRALFDRTPRGMAATEIGLEILPRLSQGFAALSGAVDAAHRSKDGVLTISVAPVFAARWLVPRLGGFAALHPDISLRIDATSRLVDPAAAGIDLCIRVGKGNWPGMASELVLKQRVFPVCSQAAAAALKRPEDLLSLPRVLDENAMFSWDLWLGAAGLAEREPPVRHLFNEASLCLDAAISGQGVMLAWQTLASRAVQTGQLAAPFGPWVETGDAHYFVRAGNARRSGKAEAFKAWLRRELAADMKALEAFRPAA